MLACGVAACGNPADGAVQPGLDWGWPGDASGKPASDHPDSSVPKTLGGDDASAAGDCPASAKLIYVTGVEGATDMGNDLYSFDPIAGKFTLIGPMSCLSNPTHMTVDRSGTAWVVAGGELYRASTENATCSRVANWRANPEQFPDFALTFIGTTSSTSNFLFILSDTGQLGTFDVQTGQLGYPGKVSLSGSSGDMTSDGDGTLYFLMQATAQTLNQLDAENASTLHTWSTGEDSENTQALAYYGGLFYDFIGDAVYTFDTKTGATESIGVAPIYVTGAGQSTCVPRDAGAPAMLK